MMPSSTSESWARICDCWCEGNTSITRLMVEDAELVCNVPKVRWPVSAMCSAESRVGMREKEGGGGGAVSPRAAPPIFFFKRVAFSADPHHVRVFTKGGAQG